MIYQLLDTSRFGASAEKITFREIEKRINMVAVVLNFFFQIKKKNMKLQKLENIKKKKLMNKGNNDVFEHGFLCKKLF